MKTPIIAGVDSSDNVHFVQVDSTGKLLLANQMIYGSDPYRNPVPLLLGPDGEPYFWGKNDNGNPFMVRVNNEGYLRVIAGPTDNHAFYFRDILHYSTIDTSLTAGTNEFYLGLCPYNEKWVITDICVKYVGTITNVDAGLYRVRESEAQLLTVFQPFVTNVYQQRQGTWIFSGNDDLLVAVHNATAGNDFHVHINGYKMDA